MPHFCPVLTNTGTCRQISRNSVLWEPNYASRTGLTKLIVAFRIFLLNPHQKSVVLRRVAASLHHSRVCAQGQQFSDFFLKRVLSKHGHSPISKRKDQNVVQSSSVRTINLNVKSHNLRIKQGFCWFVCRDSPVGTVARLRAGRFGLRFLAV